MQMTLRHHRDELFEMAMRAVTVAHGRVSAELDTSHKAVQSALVVLSALPTLPESASFLLDDAADVSLFISNVKGLLAHLGRAIKVVGEQACELSTCFSEADRMCAELARITCQLLSLVNGQRLMKDFQDLRKQLAGKQQVISGLVNQVDGLEAELSEMRETPSSPEEVAKLHAVVRQREQAHLADVAQMNAKNHVLAQERNALAKKIARMRQLLPDVLGFIRDVGVEVCRLGAASPSEALLSDAWAGVGQLQESLRREDRWDRQHREQVAALQATLVELNEEAHQQSCLVQVTLSAMQSDVERVIHVYNVLADRLIQRNSFFYAKLQSSTMHVEALVQKNRVLSHERDSCGQTISEINRRLAATESAIAERDRLVATLDAEVKAALAAGDAKMRQAVDAVDARLKAEQAEHERRIEEATAEHKKEVAALKADQQSREAALRQEYELKLTEACKRASSANPAKPSPKAAASNEAPASSRKRRILVLESQAQRPHVVISGFHAAEDVARVRSMVEALRGTVDDGPQFPETATHVVTPPGYASLRTLYGLFSGRWLVTEKWLVASKAAGFFVRESDHGGTKLGSAMQQQLRRLRHSARYASSDPTYGQMCKVMAALGSAESFVTTTTLDRQCLVAEGEEGGLTMRALMEQLQEASPQ